VKIASLLRQQRPVLRVQLTALYSGLFVGLLAVVLGVSGVLFRSTQSVAGPDALLRGGTGTGAGSREFDAAAALIALAAVGVAILVAWWLAGRFLRPLGAISTTAQEISATNLHRRLALKGPDDELTALGRTLDDLFGRLEDAFVSQRRFIANASHELRTPLAGQKTLLQVAIADPDSTTETLRTACDDAVALVGQQERLIEALLTLASSEGGLEHSERVDLAAVAERALASPRAEIDERGLEIRADLTPASFAGDDRLAQRLVANLVDNAVRHNVVRGYVQLSTRSDSGRAVLSVSNSGPDVAPGDVERLFQPFQRARSLRVGHSEGHGLGLSIVQAIARAHGAELTARARPEGGLYIEVVFPVAPVP
jgi:signal transduction histidine kinase